ncbi:hypothetical protein [uncultured Formosa sp.]|uniref:hypothetical protein n=1 Tax=uncultured Formosa sp. TaxID=255435 RepID=UPI00261AC3B4|nr:hypothetical protein [uncultured Formosa sp.]
MTLERFKNQCLGSLEMPEILAKIYQFEAKHHFFCKDFQISVEEISLPIDDVFTYNQYIKPFGYTGDGLTAFWVQENKDVENAPIVYFNSGGSMRIIAKNFKTFMQILTLDVEICSDMFKIKADYKESEYKQTYIKWIKKEFDLDPVCDIKTDERYGYSKDIINIIDEAEMLYKAKFMAWHEPFSDIEDYYNDF